jgi:cyclopropane-fatty-acyl-phospholipid synthase
MTSMIYSSQIAHTRYEPVLHSFVYPLLMFGFDLNDLPDLGRRISLFGYNRRRPVSIHDSDYLSGERASIKEKLLRLLQTAGPSETAEQFLTITMPRIWGYSFNPVSLHLVYGSGGRMISAVADVNNTFKERHSYILTDPEEVDGFTRFMATKVFHVSPFFDRQGQYEFWISDLKERFDIRINLFREGRLSLSSHLWGESHPLTSRSLALALVRFPLSTFQTMPRILAQAARLHYARKLQVFPRPEPASPLTVSMGGLSLKDRIARRILHRRLSLLAKGKLTFIEPNGSRIVFEGKQPGYQATVHIRNSGTYWKTLVGGDIGFGECYMRGDWNCDDLPGLLLLLLENRDDLGDYQFATSFLSSLRNRLFHWSRRNTATAVKRNIQDHYDLGNEFFQLFLDKSMNYSCAEFMSDDESLEQAQANKIHNLLKKANLSPCQEVLEIGCGWGALCLEAARQFRCRVTGITLSQRQLEYAQKQVRQEEAESVIQLRLEDYRSITGSFDRIISVEMLEAVGQEFLGKFLETCDHLLKPGGRAILQTIIIAEERYAAYARGCDWIQKHIFPGGFLPSLSALRSAIADDSSLVVNEIEHLGFQYVRTIRAWRQRFQDNRDEILNLGFPPEFYRKWEYYFAYCEAGFAAGALDVVQIVLDKPGDRL